LLDHTSFIRSEDGTTSTLRPVDLRLSARLSLVKYYISECGLVLG
jgi:hypothetical protein